MKRHSGTRDKEKDRSNFTLSLQFNICDTAGRAGNKRIKGIV
jgi:hypothetical protein